MSKKAYLVAELDFGGPVPIVRQTDIFSADPQSQRRPFPNRIWATLMVTTGPTFSDARQRMLEGLRPLERSDSAFAQMLRFLRDEKSLEEHAMLYGIDRALDDFIAKMEAPAHPFFGVQFTSERRHPVTMPILD